MPQVYAKIGLLTGGEVASILRYSNASHFLRSRQRICKELGFPLPISRFGRLLWRADEVDAWIAQQPAKEGG